MGSKAGSRIQGVIVICHGAIDRREQRRDGPPQIPESRITSHLDQLFHLIPKVNKNKVDSARNQSLAVVVNAGQPYHRGRAAAW